MDKLVIQAIKSDKGYFITNVISDYQSYRDYSLKKYLFDGVESEPSFHKNWTLIHNIPKRITYFVSQLPINYRFELIDQSLASEKIPLVLKREDVIETNVNCENNQEVWKLEYAMYKSLYKESYDEQPMKEIEVDFDFIVILDIGTISLPSKFEYPTKANWNSYAQKEVPQSITTDNIIHQELDRIIFPSLIIHETPSKLSSVDTYKIIREHVKRNINPAVAIVTSDYDFCFEVAKILPLAKPYMNKKEYSTSNKRRRKPIIETILVKDRKIKIFEMTNEEDKYHGYTVIEGFEGKNESELKDNIDFYLNELMKKINEPLKECPHCNGTGVTE